MSRVGKLPIALPSGVSINTTTAEITVKGPKGALTFPVHTGVRVTVDGSECHVDVELPEDKTQRALWGLTRAMIANMVIGVTEGYKKTLEVIGVGYKFDVQSPTKLGLALGFSHKVQMDAPAGITIAADEKEKNTIHISGIDKQQVGYFSALIRGLKKPEPYKGKGIRYLGEHIRRKAGKTGGKK